MFWQWLEALGAVGMLTSLLGAMAAPAGVPAWLVWRKRRRDRAAWKAAEAVAMFEVATRPQKASAMTPAGVQVVVQRIARRASGEERVVDEPYVIATIHGGVFTTVQGPHGSWPEVQPVEQFEDQLSAAVKRAHKVAEHLNSVRWAIGELS